MAVSVPPDLSLARDALAGEARALQEFSRRMAFVPAVVGALNRRFGRPLADFDLDDLAQESLVRIWAKLPEFAGRSALETWAYPFCYLEFMNLLRRKQRLERVVLAGDDELGSAAGAAPGRHLEYEHVHRALEHLPAAEADALRLKCFDGLTFDEIAERLSIPANTVRTHFYRGLRHLREKLGPVDREESLR